MFSEHNHVVVLSKIRVIGDAEHFLVDLLILLEENIPSGVIVLPLVSDHAVSFNSLVSHDSQLPLILVLKLNVIHESVLPSRTSH